MHSRPRMHRLVCQARHRLRQRAIRHISRLGGQARIRRGGRREARKLRERDMEQMGEMKGFIGDGWNGALVEAKHRYPC